VSLVHYTAGIINWRKDELEAMDRKTRKMMTIYNSLHPRADVDRLYIPRKHGGRGLISIQQSIYMGEQSLSRYIEISEEELLAATRRENILNGWNGQDNKQLKYRLMQEHKEKWMTKPLHGQLLWISLACLARVTHNGGQLHGFTDLCVLGVLIGDWQES